MTTPRAVNVTVLVDVDGGTAATATAGQRRPAAHAYCLARPRHKRCRAVACRWHYPPGTPLHAQTARMLHHTTWSIGVWAVVWVGLWIRHRYGKTGMWIYIGALMMIVLVGNVIGPDLPPDPAVVTVTPVSDPPAWSTR